MEEYHKYVPSLPDGSPVVVPLFCDGLSCERADGAQGGRLNGSDKWSQLQGLEPAIQEWHRRQLLLQVIRNHIQIYS